MQNDSSSFVSLLRSFFGNLSVWEKVAIVLFFVLLVAIILIAIVSTILSSVEEDNVVDVTNFSEVSDAPREYQSGVEETIWQLIERNGGVVDSSEYNAVIREGSYHEETNKNVSNASFIVDIEELRYSFEVSLSWPRGGDKYTDMSINVRCPYYTDVIYPDTKCVAEKPMTQIGRYLPHNYYLDNGKRVHIDQSNFGGESHLLVYIDACKNKDLIDAAMNYTSSWIESLYMDPNDLKIETYDTCLTSFKRDDDVVKLISDLSVFKKEIGSDKLWGEYALA